MVKYYIKEVEYNMKRITKFFVALSMMLFLFAIPSIVIAESSSEWEIWTPKTEVDIDKLWTIKFSDKVDRRSLYSHFIYENITYGSIFVVRERDNVTMFIEPTTLINDEKSVVLPLGYLYDFNETYHLYIKEVKSNNGVTLREPIKMKFQTINPEFNFEKKVEKDGIEFHVMLSKTDEKLYAKVKATNVSDDTISYLGADGCHAGLSADLFEDTNAGQVKVGSKWKTGRICTAAPVQYFLKPGETIEVIEVLYPPTEGLNESNFIKVKFNKELSDGTYFNSIEIPITLE